MEVRDSQLTEDFIFGESWGGFGLTLLSADALSVTRPLYPLSPAITIIPTYALDDHWTMNGFTGNRQSVKLMMVMMMISETPIIRL